MSTFNLFTGVKEINIFNIGYKNFNHKKYSINDFNRFFAEYQHFREFRTDTCLNGNNFYEAMHGVGEEDSICFLEYVDETSILVVPVIFTSYMNCDYKFFDKNIFTTQSLHLYNFNHKYDDYSVLVNYIKDKIDRKLKVCYLLPYSGISIEKEYDFNDDVVSKVIDYIYEIESKMKRCDDFILYNQMIEMNFRTSLFSTLSYVNYTLEFQKVDYYDNLINYMINNHQFKTMCDYISNNIIIVQRYEHGNWYLFYSKYNEDVAKKITKYLSDQFSNNKNFIKFLVSIYNPSVVPINMNDGIIPIRFAMDYN